MSMEHLMEAFELIQTNSTKADFAGPRSEELICLAENRLGVNFPPTYRAFLLRLGAGSFNGMEFYGIIDDNFDNNCVPDGIWYTLSERKDYNMPNNLLIIGATGDGDLYCLLFNQDDEAPVIIYQPNVPLSEQKIEYLAADFGSFMLQSVKEYLNY